MKRTKRLIMDLIVVALLCTAYFVGSSGTALLNDLAGTGSATELSQIK